MITAFSTYRKILGSLEISGNVLPSLQINQNNYNFIKYIPNPGSTGNVNYKALEVTNSTSFNIQFWIKPDWSSNNSTMYNLTFFQHFTTPLNSIISNQGYKHNILIQYDPFNDDLVFKMTEYYYAAFTTRARTAEYRCGVDITQQTGGNSWNKNSSDWTHLVFTFNDADDVLKVYWNGNQLSNVSKTMYDGVVGNQNVSTFATINFSNWTWDDNSETGYLKRPYFYIGGLEADLSEDANGDIIENTDGHVSPFLLDELIFDRGTGPGDTNNEYNTSGTSVWNSDQITELYQSGSPINNYSDVLLGRHYMYCKYSENFEVVNTIPGSGSTNNYDSAFIQFAKNTGSYYTSTEPPIINHVEFVA